MCIRDRGTALYAANIPKPALAASVFSTVGSLNTPLAMLLLGAYLAKTDLKKVFAVRSSYTVSYTHLDVYKRQAPAQRKG